MDVQALNAPVEPQFVPRRAAQLDLSVRWQALSLKRKKKKKKNDIPSKELMFAAPKSELAPPPPLPSASTDLHIWVSHT